MSGILFDPPSSAQDLHSYLYQLSEKLNMALMQTEQMIDSTSKKQAEASGTKVSKEQSQRVTQTYQELKALIIKTADTVNSTMQTKIEELSGVYVAQGDFGDYKLTVEQMISSSASELRKDFELIEKTVGDLGEYQNALSGTIRQGVIEYNGAMRPGIAIGQGLTSHKEIRDGVEVEVIDKNQYMAFYMADRLSFWANGVELASFSGSVLTVNSIAVEDRITFNDQWEISRVSGKGFTIKWIGGGS